MRTHTFHNELRKYVHDIRKIQLKCVRLVIASQWQFWKLHTQNMGDCQSAPHISWVNRSRSAHIFRLSTSLVYDSRKVFTPCGYHWLFHDFQQQRIDIFRRFALRDQLVSEPQERIFSGPEFFRI